MTRSIANYHLYEAAGNRFVIMHLKNKFSRYDADLRKKLQLIGLKNNVDSVLVLYGDASNFQTNGFHTFMDIFEPRGKDVDNPNLAGSWSTMCGNGLRAVAKYLQDQNQVRLFINTKSGVRNVAVLSNGDYRVNMGQFSSRKRDLSKYIADFNLSKLVSSFTNINSQVYYGLNGDPNKNGLIDGEPHLVLFLRNNLKDFADLKTITTKIGQKITSNKRYFPKDINTNLVQIEEKKNNIVKVLACTYERGVEYVTQACGTGATAIGALLYQKHHLGKRCQIRVKMLGGELEVEKENNNFFLTGSAKNLKIVAPE